MTTLSRPHLRSQTSSAPRRSPARTLARAFAFGVALLCAVLLFLPVLALPFLTATPRVIALILTVVAAGLLIILAVAARSFGSVSALLIALATVAALSVAASQHFARTPAYTAADGWPLTDSIATLEQIELNGSRQWITIRGQDIDNPVLLFLAGGPGGSELAWTRAYLAELEAHFVVVNWDQAGTGKSYGAVDDAELTVERYLADAHALTQQLRARFQQEKIYVLGESWGTILGIKLVQAYPELFHAYVGSGQMVNTVENDQLGYELALNLTAERADAGAGAAIRRNGPPPYFDANLFMRYARYLMVLNEHMAAQATGDGRHFNQLAEVLTAPEYGLLEKVNWVRGLNDTFNTVYPQLVDLDFVRQARRLEVPVYFIVGRHDVNAMASLVEEYYDVLEAPSKQLIWFERSGHTPLWEESGKFVDVMVDQVLATAQPGKLPVRDVVPSNSAAVQAFFDELIPHQLRTYQIAGAAVAVVAGGELRFAQGYGYANLAQGTPVSAERTLLRTDSTGKLFVWTAVMQLVEAGRLDLDTDVNEYLDFEIPATFEAPITLRHLLSHSAGFEDQGYLFAHSEAELTASGDFLARQMPARVRPPGELPAYSNYGTALAGYIVARAAGVSFEAYVEKEIFAPLGMTRSTFRQPLPPSLAEDATTNYRAAAGELQPQPFQFMRIPSAGEGHMTVTDMARFMQVHLAEGDTPILEAETLAQMHGRLLAAHPDVNGFAYGFAESTINRRRVLRHEGNNPGMSSSSLFLLPEEGVGVYIAYNSNGGFGPGEELRKAFFNHFYPEVASPVSPVPLTAAQVDALAGSYRPTRRFHTSFARIMPLFVPAYGDVLLRANRDGTFAVRGLDPNPLTYAPLAPDHLRPYSGAADGWGALRFLTDDDGQITTLLVENQPYKAFEKVAWHQRVTVQRAVGLLALLSLAAFVVVTPLLCLVQRWLPTPRLFGVQPWAWCLLDGGGVLMLLFPAALLLTIEEAYLYGVTGLFLAALALPVLALLLAGASLLSVAFGVLSGNGHHPWGWITGGYYGAGVVAMMVVASWLYHWNLLGWRV